jgi:hypothetical protein
MPYEFKYTPDEIFMEYKKITVYHTYVETTMDTFCVLAELNGEYFGETYKPAKNRYRFATDEGGLEEDSTTLFSVRDLEKMLYPPNKRTLENHEAFEWKESRIWLDKARKARSLHAKKAGVTCDTYGKIEQTEDAEKTLDKTEKEEIESDLERVFNKEWIRHRDSLPEILRWDKHEARDGGSRPVADIAKRTEEAHIKQIIRDAIDKGLVQSYVARKDDDDYRSEYEMALREWHNGRAKGGDC